MEDQKIEKKRKPRQSKKQALVEGAQQVGTSKEKRYVGIDFSVERKPTLWDKVKKFFSF